MGPLSGIKVVEMGVFVAGPAAAAVLGDWGAEVVKIENPAGGDPIRALVSLGLALIEPDVNPALELENRNKRSVAIDVTKPQGRDVVLRMLRDADVFVSNLRAAALARAGLSYEDVKKVNPRVIYATLSGYGTRGPDKDRAAFDYAAFWARTGAMGSLGEPGRSPRGAAARRRRLGGAVPSRAQRRRAGDPSLALPVGTVDDGERHPSRAGSRRRLRADRAARAEPAVEPLPGEGREMVSPGDAAGGPLLGALLRSNRRARARQERRIRRDGQAHAACEGADRQVGSRLRHQDARRMDGDIRPLRAHLGAGADRARSLA